MPGLSAVDRPWAHAQGRGRLITERAEGIGTKCISIGRIRSSTLISYSFTGLDEYARICIYQSETDD